MDDDGCKTSEQDLSEPVILPEKREEIFREAEKERETCNYWWHWERHR